MRELALEMLGTAKQIQNEVNAGTKPPPEGTKPGTDRILDLALIRGLPGNFVRVANQVNGAYEHGWYDACAVMLRRLLEMLLIEAFAANGLKQNIKDGYGFLGLNDLIREACNVSSWVLDADGETLRKLKNIGNWSAHKGGFVANREDIDKHESHIRLTIQELIFLAKLK